MPKPASPAEAAASQRLDKWLWHVRLTKSRSIAGQLVEQGKVRINRQKAGKPSAIVRLGDVVTAILHGRVRVVKVLALPERRGAPSVARLAYEDLLPETQTAGALDPYCDE